MWKDSGTAALHLPEFVEHRQGGNNGQWLLCVVGHTFNEGEKSVGSGFDKATKKECPVLGLGKYIDENISGKQVGYFKTLKQVVDGTKFFICCQRKRNT